jgi:hypothetical protein
MTNQASATFDARCGNFVWPIVGFNGMILDSGGASEDRKLTGFGCFGQSDNVFDWIASRLAKVPTGIAKWGSTFLHWCRHCVVIV